MTRAVPEESRLYESAADLPGALWDDLEARDPEEAARACLAEYAHGEFRLKLLGENHLISLVDRRIVNLERPQTEVDFQSGLVLVCALGNALEVPPAGRMVTPHELPGGAMFFTGPHALATPRLERRYGRRPGDLMRAAACMGAQPLTDADLSFTLPGLPNLPMYVLFWAADDEFEARAVLGLDPHAKHHLALDGIYALTNLLVDRLCKADPQA